MTKYHPFMRVAHWAMALIFTITFFTVWFAEFFDKKTMYGLHKSFGLLVLGFLVVRLIAKLKTRYTPAADEPAHSRLVKLGHGLLYGFMFAVPLTMAVPAMLTRGLEFFGLKIAPIAQNPELANMIKQFHVPLAYAFCAAIVGHIAMVVYHHAVRKEPIFKRMV